MMKSFIQVFMQCPITISLFVAEKNDPARTGKPVNMGTLVFLDPHGIIEDPERFRGV